MKKNGGIFLAVLILLALSACAGRAPRRDTSRQQQFPTAPYW